MIKFRRLRWAGHVARMENGRSAFKILTGIPTEKRLRRRREDNIKMDLNLSSAYAGISSYAIVVMQWSVNLNKSCCSSRLTQNL